MMSAQKLTVENTDSDFKYAAYDINKMIDEFDIGKVVMSGVYDDLERLKPVIEDIYDKHVFYLSYWKGECGFHGWDWSKDNGRMANMAYITDGITQRVKEIYALILGGMGMRLYEK